METLQTPALDNQELESTVTAVAQIASGVDTLRTLNLKALKEQAMGLTPERKEELASTFAQAFDLKSDSLEQQIERGFDFVLGLALFLGKVIPSKNAQ